MKEAVSASETPVNFTRLHCATSQDSHISTISFLKKNCCMQTQENKKFSQYFGGKPLSRKAQTVFILSSLLKQGVRCEQNWSG